MTDMQPPKYSLVEIERRWLVHPPHAAALAGLPCRVIEDTYLEGTRLRLRRIREPDGTAICKLGKKYGRRDAASEPVTNIYLSPEEYRVFSVLPGVRIDKRRYAIAGGAIDVYPSPRSLAVFEIEFASAQEAANYVPPDFAGEEITGVDEYSGAALAARFGVSAQVRPDAS